MYNGLAPTVFRTLGLSRMLTSRNEHPYNAAYQLDSGFAKRFVGVAAEFTVRCLCTRPQVGGMNFPGAFFRNATIHFACNVGRRAER